MVGGHQSQPDSCIKGGGQSFGQVRLMSEESLVLIQQCLHGLVSQGATSWVMVTTVSWDGEPKTDAIGGGRLDLVPAYQRRHGTDVLGVMSYEPS